MDDGQIIELFFQRSEQAIRETDARYGGYCYAIANNILCNKQDSEECVSDTYLKAWNHIPPTRPRRLAAYLGRITRRLAIDRWREGHTEKRGKGQLTVAIDELDRVLTSGQDPEKKLLQAELTAEVSRFLQNLGEVERRVFILRYWYMDPVADIARQLGFSEGKVSSMLMRTRKKLRAYFMESGVWEV